MEIKLTHLIQIFIVIFILLVSFVYYNNESTNNNNSSSEDFKKLIELLSSDRTQLNNKRENVYQNKITQNTNVKYAWNEDIQRIIKNEELISTMINFLEKNNNSYLITLPEIDPINAFSFIVASMWKINRTECNRNSRSLFFWYSKCHNYAARYPYEFIFNPCIVGGSTKTNVLIDHIPNPYTPFDKRTILRKRSIKVIYTRIVFFKGKLYFDEVSDWWEDEIGIELQNKILSFSKNKNRLCFY
jgi:hypothetical protein